MKHIKGNPSMIKKSLTIITILFSGIVNSANFSFTYNTHGEITGMTPKNKFTYHEKIDPITDRNSSYVAYNDPYSNNSINTNPLERNLTWGMRISCLSEQPKVSFTIDYGYPVEKNPGSLRPTTNQENFFGEKNLGPQSLVEVAAMALILRTAIIMKPKDLLEKIRR